MSSFEEKNFQLNIKISVPLKKNIKMKINLILNILEKKKINE